MAPARLVTRLSQRVRLGFQIGDVMRFKHCQRAKFFAAASRIPARRHDQYNPRARLHKKISQCQNPSHCRHR